MKASEKVSDGRGREGGGWERVEALIDLNISTCTATVAGQGKCISIIITVEISKLQQF